MQLRLITPSNVRSSRNRGQQTERSALSIMREAGSHLWMQLQLTTTNVRWSCNRGQQTERSVVTIMRQARSHLWMQLQLSLERREEQKKGYQLLD